MILSKTYQMLEHIIIESESQPAMNDDVYDMFGCDEVLKQTQIEGLATLTAYVNGAVKS